MKSIEQKRIRREARGMTLAEASVLTGLSPATIARREIGGDNVSRTVLLDRFAGQALAGMALPINSIGCKFDTAGAVEAAYNIAEAMIAEREKRSK